MQAENEMQHDHEWPLMWGNERTFHEAPHAILILTNMSAHSMPGAYVPAQHANTAIQSRPQAVAAFAQALSWSPPNRNFGCFPAASLCSFTTITCFDSSPCTGWGGISQHMSLVCPAGAVVKSPGAAGTRADCSTWPGVQGFDHSSLYVRI